MSGRTISYLRGQKISFRPAKSPTMIETPRLILMPLSYDQVLKYALNDNSLEQQLNLNETSREISEELHEALEQTILPNIATPGRNYLFSTLWTLIWREEQKMVGDLCFFGEPDAAGEIEIGYGTYDAFQNRGFMTEAVGGMIEWAKTQPGVKSIRAGTNKDNAASSNVLVKNNFRQFEETDTVTFWRIYTT